MPVFVRRYWSNEMPTTTTTTTTTTTFIHKSQLTRAQGGERDAKETVKALRDPIRLVHGTSTARPRERAHGHSNGTPHQRADNRTASIMIPWPAECYQGAPGFMVAVAVVVVMEVVEVVQVVVFVGDTIMMMYGTYLACVEVLRPICMQQTP
ncbi:hypothetical protein F5B18DRAFT_89156 [Nemania serpens]|nr:hypothetical protein F5B18DRAFT_89156 [Nemania serpens]